MLKLKFIWIFILAITSSLVYGCDNDSYNEPEEPEDSLASLFPKDPTEYPIADIFSADMNQSILGVIIKGECYRLQDHPEILDQLRKEADIPPTNIVSVVTSAPGQLGELTYKNARKMDKLIVSGPLNRDDFYFMRDCAAFLNLRSVDLSAAEITKIPSFSFVKNAIHRYLVGNVYLPLYHVILPDNLEEIEAMAFANVLITEIELPASLKILSQSAFYRNPFLGDNIIYPEGFIKTAAD